MRSEPCFDASNLRELIRESKLSISELSRCSGISRSTLSRIIGGALEPNLRNLMRLADYFEVSVDYLIGRKRGYTEKETVMSGLDIGEKLKLIGLVESMRYHRDKATIEAARVLECVNDISDLVGESVHN